MAYDSRGRSPDELNQDVAYRGGGEFAQIICAQEMVFGCDVRRESHALTVTVARTTVCWNRVESPASGRNCLGRFWRDSGQSRVPRPPLRITGINMDICFAELGTRSPFPRLSNVQE